MTEKKLLSLEDLEINLDDLEAYILREREISERRKKHSYVGDLIRILFPYENGLRRPLIMHELEKQRKRDGLPIPSTFEAAVQSSYNQYSIDSDVFRKRNLPDSEAIFYAPEGKGSGRWAVNQQRASSWLRAKLSERQ